MTVFAKAPEPCSGAAHRPFPYPMANSLLLRWRLRWSGRKTALGFLWRCFRDPGVAVSAQAQEPERVRLPHPGGAIEALCFSPEGHQNDKPKGGRGAVAVINGYAARGHQDPRMQALARALAGEGYTAYMPIIDEIEALRLDPVVPQRIGHFLQSLAEREAQPVGLMAASIAAGMSIVAVSKPDVRPCVRAILAIGPYGDLGRTVDHVMERSSDPYGRHVIWLNFVERMFGPSPTLLGAFRTAIDDDGWKRNPPKLPAFLAAGDPLERSLFRRLTEDKAFAEMHWRDVRRGLERQRDYFNSMDALRAVDQLRCPLFLVHGATDGVVPAAESKALFARMREAEVPGDLLLTPLLTHADTQIGPSFPWHASRMAALFGAFFTELEGGSTLRKRSTARPQALQRPYEHQAPGTPLDLSSAQAHPASTSKAPSHDARSSPPYRRVGS